MRCGCHAWLMLVQPARHVVAMEADMCPGVGNGSKLQFEATHWNNLVAEFADVFKLPDMPAECKTVHRIKVEPGDMPSFTCQYQVLAAEIVEIHR